MGSLVWAAYDAVTGQRIADDIEFTLTSSVTRWLGQSDTSLNVSLPAVPEALPYGWRGWSLTNDVVIALRDADAQPGDYAIAAGILRGHAYGSELRLEWIALPAERILAAWHIGEPTDWPSGAAPRSLPRSYHGTFPTIASQMGLAVLAEHFGEGACIIRDYGGIHEREWEIEERKDALSALQDLLEVDGGPEWTIRWRLTDSMGIQCVPEIGQRIGRGLPADGGQPGLLDVEEWKVVQDYSGDAYANYVVATGKDRLSSTRTNVATASPRVLLISNVTSYDVENQAPLDAYATAKLAKLEAGRKTLTAKLSLLPAEDGTPNPWKLGVTLDIGDTVRINCVHELPELSLQPLCRIVGITLEIDDTSSELTHAALTLEVISWET